MAHTGEVYGCTNTAGSSEDLAENCPQNHATKALGFLMMASRLSIYNLGKIES